MYIILLIPDDQIGRERVDNIFIWCVCGCNDAVVVDFHVSHGDVPHGDQSGQVAVFIHRWKGSRTGFT